MKRYGEAIAGAVYVDVDGPIQGRSISRRFEFVGDGARMLKDGL